MKDDESFDLVSEINIKDSVFVTPKIDLLKEGERSRDYKVDLYGDFRSFTVITEDSLIKNIFRCNG